MTLKETSLPARVLYTAAILSEAVHAYAYPVSREQHAYLVQLADRLQEQLKLLLPAQGAAGRAN